MQPPATEKQAAFLIRLEHVVRGFLVMAQPIFECDAVEAEQLSSLLDPLLPPGVRDLEMRQELQRAHEAMAFLDVNDLHQRWLNCAGYQGMTAIYALICAEINNQFFNTGAEGRSDKVPLSRLLDATQLLPKDVQNMLLVMVHYSARPELEDVLTSLLHRPITRDSFRAVRELLAHVADCLGRICR